MVQVKESAEPERGARTYVSPVRAAAARQTRQAILAAAAHLFVTGGYEAASLRQIADVAGVARPTVTAVFGSKAAILKAALDEALAGDDESVPVAQRPWFRPVLDARTRTELVRAYAAVCGLIGQRAATLFEVARRAADVGPDTHALWESTVANRRSGAGMVGRRLAEIEPGQWPEGSPQLERAIDGIWLLNDPAHYAALVTRRAWSEDQYRAWLSGQLAAAIAAAEIG